MCYRDKTFCDFWRNCGDGAECPKAFTQFVQEGADKWWGKPNAPIAKYGSPPRCYKEVK